MLCVFIDCFIEIWTEFVFPFHTDFQYKPDSAREMHFFPRVRQFTVFVYNRNVRNFPSIP